MNVNVNATEQQDGSARVEVRCDGQAATLVFDGQDVDVTVHEPRDGT